MTDHLVGHWPVEELDDVDAASLRARIGITPRPLPARPSVFGPGAVLTARLPRSDTGANTADPHLCDAYTGPIMAIADATPVICSAGVASPCGLDLLGAAGVPVSREIRTYRTAQEFQRLVADVIG